MQMAQSSNPPAAELLFEHAGACGYTTENLPALAQYRRLLDCGNLEAAARIGKNLKEFLEKNR